MSYFDSDEYVAYIRKHCDFREDHRLQEGKACTRPDLEIVHGYTDHLGLGPGKRILEVGCGTGRIMLSLQELSGADAWGVDISKKIVALAHERYPETRDRISSSPGEELHFPDQSFDAVLCWGVFDLTDQARALAAMMRVLRVGGRLLLTGKNDNFHNDDSEALAAERSLRERKVPNHFTNFSAFAQAIELLGGVFTLCHFFPRRGDFMRGRPELERPDHFYEYAVVVNKLAHREPSEQQSLASLYSKTWLRVMGESR